jgi:hypothetical protein
MRSEGCDKRAAENEKKETTKEIEAAEDLSNTVSGRIVCMCDLIK